MKQACRLKELAVEEHVTVITFDMALYEKALQLVDTRTDLKGKVLPRRGELRVAMAALRALGSSIENFEIDDAWIEADVYGSAAIDRFSRALTTSVPCARTSAYTCHCMSWQSNSSLTITPT